MAFANDPPQDSITWPANAQSGETRIVVGAETPAELSAYGAVVAILFYIRDAQSDVEVGYFFIASSNILDFSANDNVMFMGHVIYPTPGNPNSPTSSDVKTHFQINMDEGEENVNGPVTKFKDYRVAVNDTVPKWSFDNPITEFRGADLTIGSDITFSGWPIQTEAFTLKQSDQGTSQVTPVFEYDQDLYVSGFPAGTYEIEFYVQVFGPAASGGLYAQMLTMWETVGTLTGPQVKQVHGGPPDVTASASLTRTDQNTRSQGSGLGTTVRYGVQNATMVIQERAILTFTTDNNAVFLKFTRNSAAAPAGDISIGGGSYVKAKRWA